MYYQSFFQDFESAYAFWHRVTDKSPMQIQSLIKHMKGNVLDCGCGEGDEISKANPQYLLGFDTSSEALDKYLVNNPKAMVLIHSIENFYGKGFDMVLFSHSLYSMDPKEVSRYKKMLNPNGKIFIFLESKKSNVVRIRKKYWYDIHKTSFPETSAEDISEELDCSITEMNYNVLLGHLQDNRIKKKLIPFLFRTNNEIPEQTLDQITQDIYDRSPDNKMPCVTHQMIYQVSI